MSAICKFCRQEITWVKENAAGKMIPVNTTMVTIITYDGNVITGRQKHRDTCPAAKTAHQNRGAKNHDKRRKV
jgi:hypothetical protein